MEGEKRTVVLVILDKVTLEDLKEYAGPTLRSMMEQGKAALKNVNTGGAVGAENGYLTVGSGARVQGDWSVRKAFNRGEEVDGVSANKLYLRHSEGGKVPPGEILHLYPYHLHRLNEDLPYPAAVGALGETLQENGLSAAVLGNADTDKVGRQVVSIAMNEEGVVDYGDVGTALLKDDGNFPFGHRSDASAYLQAFRELKDQVSLVAVEWGDTARVNEYMDHIPLSRRGDFLSSSFRELDIFLGGIQQLLEGEHKIMFITPSPPVSLITGGQLLTPLVVYSSEMNKGGMLQSATTRREGIVTNIDIVPSIFSYLGIESPYFLWGEEVRGSTGEEHLKELSAVGEGTRRIYNQRPGIIRGFIITHIILLLGGLGLVLLRIKKGVYLFPFITGLYYFPVAVLLAPAFNFFPLERLLYNVLFMMALTAVLTAAGLLLFRQMGRHLIFIGLLTSGLLIFDLLQGAELISHSFLGYDPVGGARFYGIGNEYMGLLLGSFILGFGSLFSAVVSWRESSSFKPRFYIFLGVYVSAAVFVLYLLASPVYGANFGGAVSAAAALAFTLGGILNFVYGRNFLPRGLKQDGQGDASSFLSFKGRLSKNAALFLLFLFMSLTALLVFSLNVIFYEEALSHMGRSWELIKSNGWGELVNIVYRKVEMNLTLIRHSLWSRLLLVFLAVILVIYHYPLGMMRAILEKQPGIRIALGGTVAGGIAAFIFNDSGVVSAATTMLYGSLPLLLFSFKEL